MAGKLKKYIKQRIPVTFLMGMVLLLLPLAKTFAQPIPVGDIREEQYRLLQLLSDSTITTSFSNRPLWQSTYRSLFKQNTFDSTAWWGQAMQPKELSFSIHDYPIKIGAYEPVFTNTINSKLPYGENNGAAWYGRGLTTELQGGFYATSKYFTITLRPHLFYSQNKDFKRPGYVPTYAKGDIRYVEPGTLPEYKLGDLIDRPFRFGPDAYTTLDWGQTSVRVHYNKFEAGVSNETLWWGPGIRYALAMSNNATGMPHAFIGSRKPVRLPWNVGDLDFRWIFARPEDSPYFDLAVRDASGIPKTDKRIISLNSTRFLNGLNVVYTPSFLPNLSIGLSRVIQQYVPEGGLSFGDDILGVFRSFPDPNDGVSEDSRDDGYFEEKDPISSLYFRWGFPESNAEFYGEYYKGDHNVNLRDFLMEPQHGRAYTLGIQKLLQFNGAIDFMRINAEINSLVPGLVDNVRPQTYLYTHATIKQGYTNRGQVLGAAIGPGSSSQFLGIDGYFKHGKLGMFVQRQVLNNHFHYEVIDRYFPGGNYKDQFHHYINLNLGLTGTYKIGPVLLDGKIMWNRNFNYGHINLTQPAFYSTPVLIIDNFQYQLSLRYLF